VKKRFQNRPFKFNLHRYTKVFLARGRGVEPGAMIGSCNLKQRSFGRDKQMTPRGTGTCPEFLLAPMPAKVPKVPAGIAPNYALTKYPYHKHHVVCLSISFGQFAELNALIVQPQWWGLITCSHSSECLRLISAVIKHLYYTFTTTERPRELPRKPLKSCEMNVNTV
jgi:hypothetical protein